MASMAAVVSPQTLESLQYRDGARRVFTDQAGIICTKREAPWSVRATRMKGQLHPTINRNRFLKRVLLHLDDNVD